MYEEEMRVQTADGEMTTFVTHPDSPGPFPVAVLYMDGIGYREQVKQNARRFAADGYYCVAPDLFYRSGEKLSFDPSQLGDEGLRERLMSIVRGLRPEMVRSDTEAIFAAIADDPTAWSGPKVSVGYCMGARFAMHAAALTDEFAATAGIHPAHLSPMSPTRRTTNSPRSAARSTSLSPRTTNRQLPRSSSASAKSSSGRE